MGVFGKEKKSGPDHWLTGNLDRRKKSNRGLEGGLRNLGNKAVDELLSTDIDDDEEEALSPEEERRIREEERRRQEEYEKRQLELKKKREEKLAQKNAVLLQKKEKANKLKEEGKILNAFYLMNRKLTIFGIITAGLIGFTFLGSPDISQILIGIVLLAGVSFILFRFYKEKKMS